MSRSGSQVSLTPGRRLYAGTMIDAGESDRAGADAAYIRATVVACTVGQVMQMAAGPGPEFPDTRADGSGPFRLPTCYGTGADPPASGSGGSSPSSPTAPSSTWRSSPRRRSKRAATAAAPWTSSRCTRHPPRRAPRNRTPPAVSCRPRTRSPGSRSGSGPDLAQLSAQVGCVPNVVQPLGTDSFGAGFGQSSPGMMPNCSAAAPVPVAWLSRRPQDRGHHPWGEEL